MLIFEQPVYIILRVETLNRGCAGVHPHDLVCTFHQTIPRRTGHADADGMDNMNANIPARCLYTVCSLWRRSRATVALNSSRLWNNSELPQTKIEEPIKSHKIKDSWTHTCAMIHFSRWMCDVMENMVIEKNDFETAFIYCIRQFVTLIFVWEFPDIALLWRDSLDIQRNGT